MSEYVYYREGGAHWIVPVGTLSIIRQLDLSTGEYVSRKYLYAGVDEHGRLDVIPDPDNPAEDSGS